MKTKKRKHRGPDRISGRAGNYPVGTVRIRHGDGSKGNQRCRYIKIRMDGPPHRRWITYARFVWEANHGPVPAGKVVGRLDGNMLNDDLSNLRLMTLGDVVGLAHMRDPQMSRKNYLKAGKATAKMNRERAHFRRSLEYLPTLWYPVFARCGQVLNEPHRKRNQVLRACGVMDHWRTAAAAALGYPGRPLIDACCLVAGEADSFTQLVERVNQLRAFAGWAPSVPGSVSSAICRLRHEGLFERDHGIYRATSMALLVRGRKSPVISVRGDRLRDDPLFACYRRVWEVEGVCVQCGCTEQDACIDDESGAACSWAAPGLCSHCEGKR